MRDLYFWQLHTLFNHNANMFFFNNNDDDYGGNDDNYDSFKKISLPRIEP